MLENSQTPRALKALVIEGLEHVRDSFAAGEGVCFRFRLPEEFEEQADAQCSGAVR